MHQKSAMSSGCFLAIRIFVCLLLYWVNKISIRANIQMVNRGDAPCTSNLHARTSLPSAFNCLASQWLWYDIILVGQREFSALNTFLKGVCPGLQQFFWRYWCNSCWSHGSCTIFCLCVNWHPRPIIDTNYTCMKGENQLEWWLCYQQVRICLCISCKPLCCNPHSLGRLHWICVRLAWLWRVDSLYLLSPMHQQDPMHSSLPWHVAV